MSQHKRNGIWKKIQTWSILPFLVIAQLLYKPLGLSEAIFLDILNKDMWGIFSRVHARLYLQLPLRQWGAGNVYFLVLFSWKVNIAKNPIAVMGL